MELPYQVRSAFQSLRRERWINLLSCVTVAASLLITVLILLIMFNLERFASNLPEQFKMVVYLKDDVSDEDRAATMQTLKTKPYTAGVEFISREAALEELKRTLKDVSNAIEGLGENPLAPSIEMRLKKERVSADMVKPIADEIRALPGVSEVYYEAKIAETVFILKSTIEKVSIAILCIVLFVVLFVISSTVKILFYRRKTEIEVIKLLGATGGFIRTPFIIEGSLIGLLGGGLASLATVLLAVGVMTNLSDLLPVLKSVTVPVELYAGLPLAGLFMGLLGALISVGRIRLP